MARALTCAHGLDICPRCTETASWPDRTTVLDHEGMVLEAAGRLRDLLRAGRDTDLAVVAVADAMDELDELFFGIPEVDRLD